MRLIIGWLMWLGSGMLMGFVVAAEVDGVPLPGLCTMSLALFITGAILVQGKSTKERRD